MQHARDGMDCAVRVLTINTHKGFTSFNRRFMLEDLRKALQHAAPDIVFLQEVIGQHRTHARRISNWPTESQYEFLADTLWQDYAYGRNAVYPQGDHGNAILSRFPILRHGNHDVSLRKGEPRGLLECVVDVPGQSLPLHVVCVHLALREAHRQYQLRRLVDWMRQRLPENAPLIIAGDFNDWNQRAHRILDPSGLCEIYTHQFGKPARSFPAVWPWLRLDRIYVRNVRGSRAQPQASRIWAHLSDHLPLGAEIAL